SDDLFGAPMGPRLEMPQEQTPPPAPQPLPAPAPEPLAPAPPASDPQLSSTLALPGAGPPLSPLPGAEGVSAGTGGPWMESTLAEGTAPPPGAAESLPAGAGALPKVARRSA